MPGTASIKALFGIMFQKATGIQSRNLALLPINHLAVIKRNKQLRVALLEDDRDQGRLVQNWLRTAGHGCTHFTCSRTFIQNVKRDSFDLLILDWLVPDRSGLDVLRWVRENLDWLIPVIFVTAMDCEDDIVRGLELGADDYITKPVRPRELLARIGAVTRRSCNTDESHGVMELEPYQIDPGSRSIRRNGETIKLTQKEYELAFFLFRNLGRVLSRAHILENVWGRNPVVNTRTIDTHVCRIRGKLGIAADSGWRLSSIYQHGYRMERVPRTNEN
jgi:DNA-binding response OmpR family regulator